MERLLADAQELSGVEYNIDNLGDVYAAIHVIQEDLGLTGVAAEEASGTFTGSLAAMKAAGTNLLADLSLGNDIQPALAALGVTVQNFVLNNLFPMLGNILQGIPDLLSGLSSTIIGALNIMNNNPEAIVQTGIDIVTSLVSAIVEAVPYLVEAAWNLISAFGTALINTDWVSIGTSLIESLRSSIDTAAGEILGTDTLTIDGFLSGITAALPGILSKGIEIITNLANGIMQNLPMLITTAGSLITQFVSFVMQNYPTILQAGANLLLNLVNGIVSNLPQIVSSVVQVIGKIVSTVASNLPQILQQGILIIGKLVAGLIQAIPQVVAAIPQIINSIKNTFSSVDWGSVGRNLIQGIANGLSGAASLIVDAAKNAAQSAFNAAKSFLGINSPATKGIWLGDMYDEGVAVGIKDNAGEITKATNSMMDDAFGALTAPQAQFDFGSDQSSSGQLVLNMTINGAEGQDINALAEIIQNKINNAVRSKELAYA